MLLVATLRIHPAREGSVWVGSFKTWRTGLPILVSRVELVSTETCDGSGVYQVVHTDLAI